MANKLHTKGSLERYKNSKTANWQSGTGSSGETGADLVTIGTNDAGKEVHSAIVDISALTAAATISIRLYQQVNGNERCILDDDFVVGTDPQAIPVINSPIGISEALRIEIQSNNALDNGLSVAYEYTWEEK